MARIETVKNVWGHNSKIINVDFSVGANAVNFGFDVVMVKALLVYVHRSEPIMKLTGLNPTYIPSPHDFTAYGLDICIKKFQKGIQSLKFFRNYKLSADGRISRAPGTATKGNLIYTIAALNFIAALVSHQNGKGDHTKHIFELYKHLVSPDENGEINAMSLVI